MMLMISGERESAFFKERDTGLDPKTIRKWWEYPPSGRILENGHAMGAGLADESV